METWKILVISLVTALAVGLIGGTAIGKIMVKRAKSPHKSLLSTKERVVYSACVLLGTALVLFGVFFNFNKVDTTNMSPDGTQIEQGTLGGGNVAVGEAQVARPRSGAKPVKMG